MAAKFYWQKELHHSGLNKYRVVKAETRRELDNKVNAILAQWDEQWRRAQLREVKMHEREQKQHEREKKQIERAVHLQNVEKAMAYANELTKEAERTQSAMDSILVDSLNPRAFDFNILKDFEKYPEPKPERPKQASFVKEPLRGDEKYNPKASFFMKLSKKKMEEFDNYNQEQYDKDHNAWEAEVKAANEYDRLMAEWEKDEANYLASQEESNKSVDDFAEACSSGEPWAIERYTSLLLSHIKQPFTYEQGVDVEFSAEEKKAIIDLLLPTKEDIPTLKAVTYVKSKAELKNSFYPESYLKTKYDHVIYQIVLQTFNYVFSTIDKAYLQTIIINGKIKTIDKATGNSIEPYVLSVSLDRMAFENINLSAVDPKTWFKSAKGVSAASLANVAPIAPLVRMSKEDSRFIEGYGVVDSIDESMNLAAMDWQDFENLIREIFEQEFNSTGGEVKITQASRDGGVDAVAFDPDPIRGGKIVIQAKRYTNVVGVSAVRDLYGTVMNEGATKGILVTTSNFGNDAYDFAQGKPLTLMNGANLLFLLEKHGHKARIDIHEAKKMFAGSQKES